MTIYETAALIGGYTIEDPGKLGTLTATFSLNPGHGIYVHERPFWLTIQSWEMLRLKNEEIACQCNQPISRWVVRVK